MDATNQSSVQTALPLSRFVGYVSRALSREPVLLGAWIIAELSDLSVSGGHCYMTLIEKDAAGVTVARMRATIWASRFAYIRRKFLAATGHELANGMKVMLYGGVNFHSSYGLSFNIGEIDPSYTMGDLERLRREILMALQKEGVLQANKALPVPEPPQRVAVISSQKAAGYGDFMHQLEGNSLGAVFYSCLFPAIMQGDRTAASVMRALDMVEQSLPIMKWDCVVIIRGGGATTDMNGFDNLELARRVATFPLPVIVGIGHERDRCVLDEIACVRCKTPTAAAAWLIDRVGADWQRTLDLIARVSSYASERLRGEQLRLHALTSRLPLMAQDATAGARVRLEGVATTLRLAAARCVERENTRLQSLERLIGVLDPAATLSRGYSITRINGKAVSDASSLSPGDILETTVSKGVVRSSVVEAIENDIKID